MSLNGDTSPNPEHLKKLFGQLKSMAKEAKRTVAHRRNRVFVGKSAPNLPRQLCDICGLAFDFAKQTTPGVPQISRCSDCKRKLSEGFTALVGTPKINGDWLHAFVRASTLQPGTVLFNLTDETMEAVMNKMKEKQDERPPNLN